MNRSKMAADILRLVGGKENVASVTNCMTRLRFVLKDEAGIDDERVKKIPGVMGVMRKGGQYQIIIGNEVAKCFAELKKLGVASSDEPAEKSKEKLDAQGCRQRHPGLYLRKHVRADPRIDRGWNDPGAAHDPLLMRSDQ